MNRKVNDDEENANQRERLEKNDADGPGGPNSDAKCVGQAIAGGAPNTGKPTRPQPERYAQGRPSTKQALPSKDGQGEGRAQAEEETQEKKQMSFNPTKAPLVSLLGMALIEDNSKLKDGLLEATKVDKGNDFMTDWASFVNLLPEDAVFVLTMFYLERMYALATIVLPAFHEYSHMLPDVKQPIDLESLNYVFEQMNGNQPTMH